MEIKTVARTDKTYKTKDESIKKPISAKMTQAESKIKSEDLKKVILSVTEVVRKDSQVVENKDPNEISATPPVTSKAPAIDTPQFKVTFKRGKKVETVQELKITLMKGIKPSFKLKTIPAPDTSAYYVNINPYKLNFKL